jgi:muramoyltetrapeptide carboxypeptidase
VLEGNHLYDSYHQYAGNDEARAIDFLKMLNDESIRAIICSRGGYGTVRIIDRIDFSNFVKDPKWIIGYSDITVFHSHINRHFNTETLHAIMPVNIKSPYTDDPSVDSLKKALFGKKLEYTVPTDSGSRRGKAEGVITGGNLSMLYSLIGSPSDIDTDGKILFIEELDEYLYHIDRMMMNLKRSGKLNRLEALIVGGMTGMRDNKVPYGKTANEIVMETVAEYNYPVVLNFPAGHTDDNRALIMGRKIRLEVSDQTILTFD